MSLKHDSFKKLRKEKKKWKVETPEEFEEREDTFLKERLLHKEPTIHTFVRITAGKVKNFKLEIPKTTRPLTDRMKVKVFDILREDIFNKNVLDLYAGAGSFGLEALSRGAKHVTFVEASKNADFVIKNNVAKTGFLLQTEIIRSKTEDYLFKQSNSDPIPTFDIIFLDPPYKLFNTKKTFKMESVLNMASQLLPGVQNPDSERFKGALILKHPKRYPLEKLSLDNIEILESEEFGLNTISFFIVKR
jgi:16S rRNA (guanine(966)-N(2))-methyltransferase RsmD